MDAFAFGYFIVSSCVMTGFMAGMATADFRDSRALFVGATVTFALLTIAAMTQEVINYLAAAP